MWFSSLIFGILGYIYGRTTDFPGFDILALKLLLAVFMFFLGYGIVQHKSMLELTRSLIKHEGKSVLLIPILTFLAAFSLMPLAQFFHLETKTILLASLLSGWLELAPVFILAFPEAAPFGFLISLWRQFLSLLFIQISAKNNLLSMSPSGVISMNIIYNYLQESKVNTAVTAALSWMLGLLVVAFVIALNMI